MVNFNHTHGAHHLPAHNYGKRHHYVKQNDKAELKEKVFNWSAITLDATGTNFAKCLTQIDNGTTTSTRVGFTLSPHSLYMKGWVNVDPAVAVPTAAYNVRLLVVQDREPYEVKASQPPFPCATFLDGTVEQALAPIQIAFSRRFKILSDKTFTVNAQKITVPFHIFKNLKGRIKYRTNDNDTRSAGEGAIYVYALTSYAVNAPNLTMYSKIRYTDM